MHCKLRCSQLMQGDKQKRIAALRLRLQKIGQRGIVPASEPGSGAAFGPYDGRSDQGPLAAVIPEGVFAPGLHEVRPAAFFDLPAALGFATALIAQTLALRRGEGLMVWRRGAGAAEFGTPYPAGLMAMGVDPARLLFVEARNLREALWCLEEGLRAGLVLVAGDVGDASAYDLTASRRLDLAARKTGALAFVFRGWRVCNPSAARTRFRVGATLGEAAAHGSSDGLAGLGERRWRVELERVVGARPRVFEAHWDEKAHSLHLATPLAERPAASPAQSDNLRPLRRAQ